LPLTRGVFLGRLFAPVDIASLVFFRIAFGVIMVWEVAKYFVHGWIRTYYIDPSFHFTYYGFGWVQPWPGYGMYLHFLVLGVLAACVALGLWYRVSIVLFFVAFTYVYLLDQALYLNHFYLAALVSFLMIFVPAQRLFSIDVLRKPEIRSETSPAWSVWMLAAQMAIVYLYGGLAKLNGDWLRGEPMRGWLAAETDLPVVGPLFDDEWLVYFFSYGGMLT
jgi:vitamin K-dependent gamma-carboxylase